MNLTPPVIEFKKGDNLLVWHRVRGDDGRVTVDFGRTPPEYCHFDESVEVPAKVCGETAPVFRVSFGRPESIDIIIAVLNRAKDELVRGII